MKQSTKIAYIIAGAANRLLMACTAVFAVLLVTYAFYVLYDIFHVNQNAFVSRDLLKYRPVIAQEDEEPVSPAESFAALREINKDTVGWLEIFGTHINYPVMQGSNDLEYLNKDIYGNTTLSGSIYLAAENDSAFNDWYSLIYGHHMDNGAMFGDIDKYLDPDYFAAHNTGILQTPDGAYDIRIFACVSTDSYEVLIYNVDNGYEDVYPALRDYITEHAYHAEDVPEEITDEKLMAFSTCTDAVTNGRIVLFASASPRDPQAPYPTEADTESADGSGSKSSKAAENPVVKKLIALGHLSDSGHFALLNLICVLLTLCVLLPGLSARRKYRQLSYAKKQAQTAQPDIAHDLKDFVKKIRIGIILETLLLLVSVITFLLTEDLSKQMIVEDKWTGLMILITAASLLMDFICFRYRGRLPAGA